MLGIGTDFDGEIGWSARVEYHAAASGGDQNDYCVMLDRQKD